MKVTADQTVCAAAGQCLLAAPAVFDQADDNGVVVLLDADPPETQRAAVQEAVRNCPTSAIRIVE